MTKDLFPHHAQFLLDKDASDIQRALEGNPALKRTSLRIHVHEGIVEIRAETYYALSLAQRAITQLGGQDMQHLPQEEEIPTAPAVNALDVQPMNDEDPDLQAVA